MNTADKLEVLLNKAKEDAALKQSLLNTRGEADPLAAFCKVAGGAGVELSVMDIVNQGEEFYAEIKRSTNGGGENSPKLEGEDDFYELFMAAISEKQ